MGLAHGHGVGHHGQDLVKGGHGDLKGGVGPGSADQVVAHAAHLHVVKVGTAPHDGGIELPVRAPQPGGGLDGGPARAPSQGHVGGIISVLRPLGSGFRGGRGSRFRCGGGRRLRRGRGFRAGFRRGRRLRTGLRRGCGLRARLRRGRGLHTGLRRVNGGGAGLGGLGLFRGCAGGLGCLRLRASGAPGQQGQGQDQGRRHKAGKRLFLHHWSLLGESKNLKSKGAPWSASAPRRSGKGKGDWQVISPRRCRTGK